jgi:hypothetical protein
MRAAKDLACLIAIAAALCAQATAAFDVVPHRPDAEGCVSLAAEPVRDYIDFYTDIQPILATRCASCHTTSSAGGLSLLPDAIRVGLLGDDETGAPSGYPGFRRIVPGDPAASLVFLRVNCANAGTPDAIIPRMPPGSTPTAVDLHALLHDWIAAGAILRSDIPSRRTDLSFRGGFEPLR